MTSHPPKTRLVSFSLGDRAWRVRLDADGEAALERALAPFVAEAIPDVHRPRRSRRSPVVPGPDRLPPAGEVRAWAVRSGIAVSASGRLPDEVYAAYETANSEGGTR